MKSDDLTQDVDVTADAAAVTESAHLQSLKQALQDISESDRRALMIEVLSDELTDVQTWLEQRLSATNGMGKIASKEDLLWIECARRYWAVAEKALAELNTCHHKLAQGQKKSEIVD